MITFPNAKINIGLNVVEKRPDGYHNLETVFYPIPLEDALEINPPTKDAQSACTFTLTGINIEGNSEDNLVMKAYRLLGAHYPLPPVQIHLHKHIPTGAGLGGGSSDAAYMLKLLNERFGLNIPTDKLEEYAARLGADCAFFVRNQPVYAEGIGNVFTPIKLSLKGYGLIVIKPDVFVSTRDAFAHIKPHRPAQNLQDLVKRPINEWKENIINDFEASVFPKFPIIGTLKEKLYQSGAIYAAMSGSGSSVYGLFTPGTLLPDMTHEEADCRVFKLTLN